MGFTKLWVTFICHQRTQKTKHWLSGKHSKKIQGWTHFNCCWTHLNTNTVVERGNRAYFKDRWEYLRGEENQLHLCRCSTWLHWVPDPALEDASLPTNRHKFMQSQITFLILLFSIKAVNILFLDSSLQMNNLCLYKKFITVQKHYKRKAI